MFVVVSYDVPDDRRRLKVAKTLENYGARVQFSVFECQLEQNHVAELEAALAKAIQPKHDSVRIYRLCANCEGTVRILGRGEVTKDMDFYVV